MEDDPKTVIRRMFDEVVNQRQLDRIDEFFDPDFRDHGPGVDLHGREEFRVSITAWLGAMSDLHLEVSHLIAEGDTVAWVVRSTGTHTGDSLGFPATGKRFDALSANIGIVRNGKAVEHWSEQGLFATLQQLGVVPSMAPKQAVP
jgi:predicted ester cyclase